MSRCNKISKDGLFMDNMNIYPTNEAIQAAKNNPNGWVYTIDPQYSNESFIPPEAVVGAWKVNNSGEIIGDFIPNPNYIPLKKEKT
jgi:hypothetical protein